MSYIAGIDIGGTHTDAVLVNEKGEIVRSYKTTTTFPLEEGVKKGLQNVARGVTLQAIHIGTTHALNALLEGKDLYKVGVIRIAGHRPDALKPCLGWPEFLKQKVYGGYETVDGGYECDLSPITPFNPIQIKEASYKLLDKGVEGLAFIGVFSPISAIQEQEAKEIVLGELGNDFPITLSHEVGGIGFIERENAAIVNTALINPMRRGFSHLKEAIETLGLTAPLFLTQNNGSIITLDQAIAHPLFSISSGPTNSFIGGCRLAGMTDAVVVDVGGTSTDIGVVHKGYPRRSIHNVIVGGVSLNFRAPDVLALALGGGSLIRGELIGPESCGGRLFIEGQSFGGSQLTLTDVACMTGCLTIPNAQCDRVKLSIAEAYSILKRAQRSIQDAISVMKGDKTELPVIAVGGGAAIASSEKIQVPEYHSVANAYGAALAEISATIDTVVSLKERNKTLELLKEEVLQKAVSSGACAQNVRLVDVQVIPYHYVPHQMARVMMTASGNRRIYTQTT